MRRLQTLGIDSYSDPLKIGANKYFIIFALFCNITSLTAICFVFASKPYASDTNILHLSIDSTEKLFMSVSMYCSAWLIVNVLVASVFFCVLILSEEELILYFDTNSILLWKMTGSSVIFSRFFLIVAGFLNQYFGSKVCLTIDVTYDDGSFFVPFVIMMIDVRFLTI